MILGYQTSEESTDAQNICGKQEPRTQHELMMRPDGKQDSVVIEGQVLETEPRVQIPAIPLWACHLSLFLFHIHKMGLIIVPPYNITVRIQ